MKEEIKEHIIGSIEFGFILFACFFGMGLAISLVSSDFSNLITLSGIGLIFAILITIINLITYIPRKEA